MQLSGTWRAMIADDTLRRGAIGLEYDDAHWPEITVPGHWRRQAEFADADGPLLYRHHFHLPPAEPGTRQFVTLEGLFYQADVWLDGAYLGDPEGYFFPHTFDITDLSGLADDHVLAVEVSCPSPGAPGSRRSITGVLQDSDVIGGAWNPGGLWRPVTIETTGPVRIDRLRVLCRDANDARAHLRLHAKLDADQPRTVLVRTTVNGSVLGEREHSLAKGMNEVDWNLDVKNPPLWWPWTLGEQHLSEVHVEVLFDGVVSHDRIVRTGLRQVTVQDWMFSVNGERLFIKGANLAPTMAPLAEATDAEARRDVQIAREAGLDLVRIRGHIGLPGVYDAADELGMLVWQDFPLQGGYARSVRKEAVRQAREVVDLLGHHPSIAVWCGHNAPLDRDVPSGAGPGAVAQYLLGQQVPSWNTSILDRWVKRAFERADETRTTIAHSGVAPHLPQLDGTDSHLFFGWRFGDERDLAGFAATVPRMVRFVSEFGAQSLPPTADFIDSQRWPDVDLERLADAFGMEHAAFERHAPLGGSGSFESWRQASQRYQADLLRHHIETLRRLKYRPTGGFCFSTLNDAEPRISFSVLDHQRQPKLALQAIIDACHPVIVVADRPPAVMTPGDSMALDVHVVSDLHRVLEGVVCNATVRWPGGSHTWRWTGDVPPDACVRVGTMQIVVPDAPGELWLDITVDHGDSVASNRYTSVITGR